MAEKPDYFNAIATTYRDFEFRSRLEAKWAAFFDLCGWKWSYEPIDLGGWIPDFALGERPTLVEIKPFFRIDQYTEAMEKIERSGCQEPVILLGADATWGAQAGDHYIDGPQIGWIYEPMCGFEGPVWADWDLNFGFTEGNGKLGLCPMEGGWHNYVWNRPENDRHANKWSRVSIRPDEIEEQLVKKWAYACNISKWVKVRD